MLLICAAALGYYIGHSHGRLAAHTEAFGRIYRILVNLEATTHVEAPDATEG